MAGRALNLVDAARALGVAERSLRRWITEGAPTVRRGRRGRGGGTLLDVEAVSAWRAASQGAAGRPVDDADQLRAVLAALPQAIAATIDEQFQDASGPHKRALAAEFAALGYRICFLLEDLGGPPVVELPALERLRAIVK